MKIYLPIPRRSVTLKADFLKIFVKLFIRGQLLCGSAVKDFEKLFANYLSIKYVFGVSSARCGLRLVIKAMKLEEGDEVILSVYNFSPVIDVIRGCGLKPVFVDINPVNFNMDCSLIEEKISVRTRVILATHLFGMPCDMDRIMELAASRNLRVIEDCAHSLGAKYRERFTGTFGDAALFSFGIGKNLPCFGGGMIVTNNSELAGNLSFCFNKMIAFRIFGLSRELAVGVLYFLFSRRIIFTFIYPFVLLSYFLSINRFDSIIKKIMESGKKQRPKNVASCIANFQAGMGLEGLKSVERINRMRVRNAQLLNDGLKNPVNIKIPSCGQQAQSIYLYYRITADDPAGLRRKLALNGIDTKGDDMAVCDPENISDYPRASYVHSHILEIPNDPSVSKDDIAIIINSVLS